MRRGWREEGKEEEEEGERKKEKGGGGVAGCGAAGPAKNCIFRGSPGLPRMFSLCF